MRITPSKVLNYAAAQFLTRIQKIKSLSPTLLCGFENIAAILLGKKVRFSFDENVDLFIAKEAQKSDFLKISNVERGCIVAELKCDRISYLTAIACKK